MEIAGVDGDPVEQARRYLGAPYLWGGMAERGIDCSGLVWLGDGRILHSAERDGVNGVVEELEPAELRALRRRLIRL